MSRTAAIAYSQYFNQKKEPLAEARSKDYLGFASYVMRSPILSNITIVIVEDHSDFRASLERLLHLEGAIVVARANAFEGLETVKEHHPDLVLSDISLPLRDGFELLEDIRALETEVGIHIPVIAMTAYSGVYDSRRTIAASFQAHLNKPFTSQQLLESIKLV